MVCVVPTRYGVRPTPASEDSALPGTFHIRPAEKGDIAFLQACAADAYAQYVEAIGRKPAPMVFDFAAQLGELPIEIMESDGETVGYLVWYLNEDHLFLESIAIAERYQGKGHAKRAMAYLEGKTLAAGRVAIELYTNEKMTANLSLYPHLGFVETERRTEGGFNRVYFRKTLR